MPDHRSFYVADLNSRGELHAQSQYGYEQLEQIPRALDLIALISGALWRDPEEFELNLLLPPPRVTLRWYATAPSAGIMTIRNYQNLASLSLLASGIDAAADQTTLKVFQDRLLVELHDTGYEPSFDLLHIAHRPLVATIAFQSPADPEDRLTTALADRCFAASYFRFQHLA
ncbi:MAG TPA: hypothetical protein VH518_22610 [Tepidisphaeraceae bacterium]|jgi:hypothetical protein